MTQSSSLYQNGLPLRDIVSDKVRSRIFDGTYIPGTHLVERDLAAEFEVSRSPVHEAIRMLAHEGLVESLPTRGMIVKKLARQEVVEIFDLREALDGLAARLAAQRVADGTASNLSKWVQQAQTAMDSGDFKAATIANTALHDELIAFAGNKNLQVVLTRILGRLHLFYGQVLDFRQAHREHEELVAAIDSGDPQEARMVAEHHVQSYRMRTLEYLFG